MKSISIIYQALMAESLYLTKFRGDHVAEALSASYARLAVNIKRLSKKQAEREEKQHIDLINEIDPLGQG